MFNFFQFDPLGGRRCDRPGCEEAAAQGLRHPSHYQGAAGPGQVLGNQLRQHATAPRSILTPHHRIRSQPAGVCDRNYRSLVN